MTDSQEIKNINSQEGKKKKAGLLYRVTRELISILFWSYVILKLFVFDVDVYLANKIIPDYAWILNYKFFILIGILSIVWLSTRNKQILIWLAYILSYPFIILLWKIPYFVFKQKSWILAFAFINGVISFFRSFKYNFIVASTYLVAFCLIISSSNVYLLWISIIILIGTLLVIYFNRFLLVFKPSAVFNIYSKIVSQLRHHTQKTYSLDAEIKNLPVEQLNDKQLEKWTHNLQSCILFNRLCYFVAKNLKDYQNSRLNVITYVLNLLLLVVMTVLTFAAINYGLFNIDPAFFDLTINPSFFNFSYYSFNNLLFNTIYGITPLLPLAQTVFMIQEFFAIILMVILATLFFGVRSDKYITELDNIIDTIKKEAVFMESLIEEEYELPINKAIEELGKVKASLINAIYWFSKYVE